MCAQFRTELGVRTPHTHAVPLARRTVIPRAIGGVINEVIHYARLGSELRLAVRANAATFSGVVVRELCRELQD
jgi:hypothetical protein